MRSFRDYDQSSLWKRLDELSRSDNVDRAAVDHLKSSVRKQDGGVRLVDLPHSRPLHPRTSAKRPKCSIAVQIAAEDGAEGQWRRYYWSLLLGYSGFAAQPYGGMTEEAIKNCFSEIGESYDRSPQFNQERVAAGVVSPISIVADRTALLL